MEYFELINDNSSKLEIKKVGDKKLETKGTNI